MAVARNRILVAVDGSEASFNVIQYLSGICPADRTALTLFHVLSPTAESRYDRIESATEEEMFDSGDAARKNAMEAFMERAGSLLNESGFPRSAVTVQIRARRRGIARDILQEAAEGYRAVAAGRVGMNPIGRLIMGSVAVKLALALRRRPLWLVDGCPDPQRVLVALDGSANALHVVNHVAAALAGAPAQILLFHVIRSPYPEYRPEIAEPGEDRIEVLEDEKRARASMAPVFHKAFRKLASSGFAPERISVKIVTGMATRAGTIYAQARSGGYGTIVTGRRGLSRVREFPLGRVTHKVVQLAQKAAVWVVP